MFAQSCRLRTGMKQPEGYRLAFGTSQLRILAHWSIVALYPIYKYALATSWSGCINHSFTEDLGS